MALSLSEREEISLSLAANLSMRLIASQVGRSPSTISRKINRKGGYDHYRAAKLIKKLRERFENEKHEEAK